MAIGRGAIGSTWGVVNEHHQKKNIDTQHKGTYPGQQHHRTASISLGPPRYHQHIRLSLGTCLPYHPVMQAVTLVTRVKVLSQFVV